MKITDLIRAEHIIPALRAHNRVGILREAVSLLSEYNSGLAPNDAVRALVQREKRGSTAIGEDLAIPHAKVASVHGIAACLGRSRNGIDFGSADGTRTHFFFVLLSPEGGSGEHLKILARISWLFRLTDFRDGLMAAACAREMYEFIARTEET